VFYVDRAKTLTPVTTDVGYNIRALDDLLTFPVARVWRLYAQGGVVGPAVYLRGKHSHCRGHALTIMTPPATGLAFYFYY